VYSTSIFQCRTRKTNNFAALHSKAEVAVTQLFKNARQYKVFVERNLKHTKRSV